MSFLRTQLLLGDAAIETIKNSCVIVCGVGAVGGFATEMIARCGVGNITLIDFDTVEETNINRQIVALGSTIGKKKIDIMSARIKDINPDCNVVSYDKKLTPENIDEFINSGLDSSQLTVIDAIDDVRAKVALISHCVRNGINIVSSMGAAMRRDLSKIKAGTISETKGCPLARAVRHGLKANGVDIKKINCVYSDEEVAQDIAEARNTAKVLPSYAPMTAAMGIRLGDMAIQSLLV